jgi:hypothetical protein
MERHSYWSSITESQYSDHCPQCSPGGTGYDSLLCILDILCVTGILNPSSPLRHFRRRLLVRHARVMERVRSEILSDSENHPDIKVVGVDRGTIVAIIEWTECLNYIETQISQGIADL